MGLTAFSLAFLLPLGLERLLGLGAFFLLLAGLCGILLLALHQRSHRFSAPLLAGLLLFGIRHGAGRDQAPLFPDPPGLAIPVTLGGVVGAPPWESRDHILIPLEGGLGLSVSGHFTPPLPGARVKATGRLVPSGRWVTLPGPEALTIIQAAPRASPGAWIERLRRLLRRRLNLGTTPATAGRLRALLLGDHALLAGERQRLARTGLLHLFAVSGLHLAVFLALARRGLGPRPLPLSLLLLFYALLSGFRSPVARALLIEGAGLLGAVLGRHTPRGRHLLLAMTLLLAWDPDALFHLGFLLSFSAFGGIQLLSWPLLETSRRDPFRLLQQGLWARLRRSLNAALIVSGGAFLGSLPVTLLFFHRLSWASIPGTMLLGPLVPLLLLLGLLLVILPGWPPLVLLAEALGRILDLTTRTLERLPFQPLTVPRPHPLAMALLVAALVWCALRLNHEASLKWPAGALLASLGLVLCWSPGPPPGVLLLPARSGFAALYQTPDKARILIDCGPKEAHVAEALLARGVGKLSAVVLSHRHEDHAGGLQEVLTKLAARRLLLSPGKPIPGVKIRGSFLSQGSRVGGLLTLWPPPGRSDLNDNNGSLALLLETAGGPVITLGDLEQRGLLELLLTKLLPPAEVLVVPHHGARNGALLDALLAARPGEIWIPAKAGFPAEETMLLLFWSGIPYGGTWSGGEMAFPEVFSPPANQRLENW